MAARPESLRRPTARPGQVLAAFAVPVLAMTLVVTLNARTTPGSPIKDAPALQRALAMATPGAVLELSGGLYGALDLAPGQLRGPLTIRSANPADPAIFTVISLKGGNGVQLRDLQVVSPSHDPARPYLLSVVNSSGLVLDGISVTGAGGAERLREYGLWLRNVTGAEVRNCRFSGTRYGIGLLNGRNISITANELSGLQTDGIRGGGVSELLIRGNVLTGFTPKDGEHPDGIQLWSTNQKAPARGITITDNLVARGSGRMTQGIFVRDTLGRLPFEELVIEGNMVTGTMYNGIAVLGVRGGRIANNHVIAYPDQKSWIRVDKAYGVDITGNQAPQFLVDGKASQPPGNTMGTGSRESDAAPVRLWLEARPWLRQKAGPQLTRLAGS